VSNFSPISSLLGGALIGAAATLLLTVNGKLAGISGILDGVLRGTGADRTWKALFLGGLLTAGLIASRLYPCAIGHPPPSLELLVVGGFLVGAGTRIGTGCTSGHGVCGISRGSTRSIAATIVFMATGGATVYVLRHLLPGRV